MPLNKRNTRAVHRTTYCGETEKVRMIWKVDGMDPTYQAVVLYRCRWARINKRGQQLDGDVTSDMARKLLIPGTELKRVGVHHINHLFRFVDLEGRYWMPESWDTIEIKLFENEIGVPCQRTDPIPTPGV